MIKFLGKLYRILVQIMATPIFLSSFFANEAGQEYGVGFWKKMSLVLKMIRNNMSITSGSSFIEHLVMATALLKLPKALPGCVVECGTYKGVSATNLSLICTLVGRKLEIFDSFEGLPEPSAQDKEHSIIGTQETHYYEKGWWEGTLEEVKGNIKTYGNIDVCNFHKGYFNQTLPHFRETCAQIFVDVDYRDSLADCLKNLWPLLQDGCYFFVHEAQHMEIASLFYSEKWWGEELQGIPPGLVGAGTGVGIKILTEPYFSSSLGFTIKNPKKQNFKRYAQIGGLKLNLAAAGKLTTPGAMYAGAPTSPIKSNENS